MHNKRSNYMYHFIFFQGLNYCKIGCLPTLATIVFWIIYILTIFQGWYSLLDNAPNYLVGCVIQKRSRFCTYVSSELPSSVKICLIWPLIQPKVFSWYVTSLFNWHWEPKFPAWHWLILPERFQIKIQYSTRGRSQTTWTG